MHNLLRQKAKQIYIHQSESPSSWSNDKCEEDFLAHYWQTLTRYYIIICCYMSWFDLIKWNVSFCNILLNFLISILKTTISKFPFFNFNVKLRLIPLNTIRERAIYFKPLVFLLPTKFDTTLKCTVVSRVPESKTLHRKVQVLGFIGKNQVLVPILNLEERYVHRKNQVLH